MTWMIHPRERNLSRVYDPLSGWRRLALTERYNTPDTWSVTGPPSVLSVFQPGSGSILVHDDAGQVTSGKVIDIERTGSSNQDGQLSESMTVTFADDSLSLGHRIALPSPTFPMTSSVFHFPAAHDVRSDTIESLIIGYIRSNLGDLAVADRRLARLRLPASLGRGGTTQVSARFDSLGVLISTLAEAGNLRVKVKHTEDSSGAWLDLVIETVADRSPAIRFGTASSMATGIITDWRYRIAMPTTTRAIVAGGGEQTERDMLQLTTPASETLWGEAVELLVDQRNVPPESVNKQAELTREGQKDLDEGAGPVAVSFTPVFGPDLVYRRDVQIGDIVGYDLPGLEPAKEKIREATTVVSAQDNEQTETVSVVVGTPDAPTTRTQRQIARALRTVTVLQRS